MQNIGEVTHDDSQFEPVLRHRIGAVKQLVVSLLSIVDEIDEVPTINLQDGINLHEEVLRYETELIRKALELTGHHQARAAKMLSVKTTTLHSKIKRHHIQLSPAGAASSNEDE